MYLIDTNIISEAMRPAGNPAVLTWLNRSMADAQLPTPVIFETLVGLAQLPEGRRKEQFAALFERVLQRFGPRVISFDLRSARVAAALTQLARSQGRILPRLDAQIAGIASAYDLVLVTRNISDFDGLDLKLENPWEQGA